MSLEVQKAYANTISISTYAFGWSEAWISTVFNAVTTFLDTQFSTLLRWHPRLNNYKRLQAFGQAVLQDGEQGLVLIWSFIDGRFVGFC